MTGENWKDADEGDISAPRFGRKARAWFARRIVSQFFTPDPSGSGDFIYRGGSTPFDRDCLADLVAWYVERHARFARWEDDAEFRGGGEVGVGGGFALVDFVAAEGEVEVAGADVADDDRVPLGDGHFAQVRDLDRPGEHFLLGGRQAGRDGTTGAGELPHRDVDGRRRVPGEIVTDLLAEEE